MADAFSLGGSLLEAEDVLEAVIEKMHAATLCQLKAASVTWSSHSCPKTRAPHWVSV